MAMTHGDSWPTRRPLATSFALWRLEALPNSSGGVCLYGSILVSRLTGSQAEGQRIGGMFSRPVFPSLFPQSEHTGEALIPTSDTCGLRKKGGWATLAGKPL